MPRYMVWSNISGTRITVYISDRHDSHRGGSITIATWPACLQRWRMDRAARYLLSQMETSEQFNQDYEV